MSKTHFLTKRVFSFRNWQTFPCWRFLRFLSVCLFILLSVWLWLEVSLSICSNGNCIINQGFSKSSDSRQHSNPCAAFETISLFHQTLLEAEASLWKTSERIKPFLFPLRIFLRSANVESPLNGREMFAVTAGMHVHHQWDFLQIKDLKSFVMFSLSHSTYAVAIECVLRWKANGKSPPFSSSRSPPLEMCTFAFFSHLSFRSRSHLKSGIVMPSSTAQTPQNASKTNTFFV